MPRASKAPCASSNALGRSDPLFLLGLTSCEWSPAGVRPAGAPLGCGRRRAGRAARSKREAGSQFGRNYHGGAPGGRGHLAPGGQKKTSKLAMDMDILYIYIIYNIFY
jgi:hypothetical protein